jgi:deoxyribose-phosphate aldolase
MAEPLVSNQMKPILTLRQVAKTIDHALLKPSMTKVEVIEGCALAMKYNVASVCCKPCDVSMCAKQCKGTDVLVCAVVGFPHGCSATAVKVYETALAVQEGATEIDVVINIGWLRSGDIQSVEEEVRMVVEAAAGNCVKVIFETCYLSSDEILTCCQLCDRAGAHYVKTSTGFGTSGATLQNVKLMVDSVNAMSREVKVKSSGGIRTLDQLLSFLYAVCSRAGCSGTKEMLDEYFARFGSGE